MSLFTIYIYNAMFCNVYNLLSIKKNESQEVKRNKLSLFLKIDLKNDFNKQLKKEEEVDS